jgi:hypothetical protein
MAGAYETGLKHKAARAKLRRIVEVICKPLRKLRLDEIETPHIVGVLKTVWHPREVSREKIFQDHVTYQMGLLRFLQNDGQPRRLGSEAETDHAKAAKRGTCGSHKAMDYHDLPTFMHKLATVDDQVRAALRSPS